MQHEPEVDTIIQLLKDGQFLEAYKLLEPLHQSEIADLLSSYPPETIQAILFLFPKQRRGAIFCELSYAEQADIAQLLETSDLLSLLRSLSPDDQVDLLKALPDEQYNAVLPVLAKKEREDLIKLASYPEGSAGSIMNTDYISYPQHLTIQEVLQRIRLERTQKEAIYRIYILDNEKKLIGTLSVTDLILSDPDKRLSEVMRTKVVSINVHEDQEEAVFMMARYDLVALPVVDENNTLLGNITHDDALDVMEEERTSDMERFMAIVGKHDDTTYLKTSIWTHFRKRVVWLVILAFLGLISGSILELYEGTLTSLMILAFYMPMLIDTGGNTGSQSATVMVRALALKEITPKNVLRIVWKEFRVSMLLALVLASLAFIRVAFISNPSSIPEAFTLVNIGFAVAVALAVQVVSATIIGALLPLGAAALKLDPALVASPALTTIVDITGLFIYFGSVSIILGI
ncbi:magnesium transporter [Sphaerochaeta sp. PS]|uniref:magnesium transporter n=1 Tax=Sphaerochaeta sp. PS TaxID=3076336 RepID=UPI0028A46D49|nr:magnesium transporter [Sphaerochaeta sp. PS]MDT4763437.1 magnesium transporter [Sphaerochaeta sp. PS]